MRDFSITRRRFLASAAAAVGIVARGAHANDEAQPGTPIWSGASESRAKLNVDDPSRIKILQFTDLHFFNNPIFPARDKRTVRELTQFVDSLAPDLLILTGDLWHDNPDGRGHEFQETTIERIAKLGRPWLNVWGNHDQLDDYALGHEKFTSASGCLYRGGPTGGNYSVELCSKSGEALWQMVCLNSNDAGLGKAQHDWLRGSTLPKLPSFVVAHIPLKQQGDALIAKTASGIGLEKTCNEDEDGSSLAAIKGACDARAYFCGHDHVNDFAIVADGVELVYGHATGWSGYGGDDVPKGAKLITANAQSGSYAWETVFADGTRWQPKPGVTIENVIDAPWDSLHRRQAQEKSKLGA